MCVCTAKKCTLRCMCGSVVSYSTHQPQVRCSGERKAHKQTHPRTLQLQSPKHVCGNCLIYHAPIIKNHGCVVKGEVLKMFMFVHELWTPKGIHLLLAEYYSFLVVELIQHYKKAFCCYGRTTKMFQPKCLYYQPLF